MNLKNKKIGIWGFGIVGTSVFNYVKSFTDYVQILDKKPHQDMSIIIQAPETIQKFLEDNDYIIPSPGIALHEYDAYRHKFLCELDLFSPQYHGSTIAITGTAGKTTVTDFIAQLIPNSIAAGNIGFAMLDALSLKPQPEIVILELSSYQLQYARNFAPDIAIWTNFFENHLDHHKNIDEYFKAKCNILQHQQPNQCAIVPLELVDKILDTIDYQGQLFIFSIHKPKQLPNIPLFYIENNNLIFLKKNQATIIFKNIEQLPQNTFLVNWIVILATLYLKERNLDKINFANLTIQPHRVEYVGKYHAVEIYNDSKSTIQQATQEALKKFSGKKIALIIGGMSKGADRSPLIKYIAEQKNIMPFIFGKEKEILSEFCDQNKIKYFKSETLEELLEIFKNNYQNFDILLFSPAGSSFDQFKNYQDRGNIFKELVVKIIAMQ